MPSKPIVKIARVDGCDLPIPSYQTNGAAAFDLQAFLVDAEGKAGDIVIRPHGKALVKTGFKYAIPEGYEGQIRPRSGLAAKFKITVLNAPGTIDSDYRGEVMIMLINHGEGPYHVKHAERIAQMVIAPVSQAEIQEVEANDLDETERGEGRFGSTGA